jgi:hypothetical protein
MGAYLYGYEYYRCVARQEEILELKMERNEVVSILLQQNVLGPVLTKSRAVVCYLLVSTKTLVARIFTHLLSSSLERSEYSLNGCG